MCETDWGTLHSLHIASSVLLRLKLLSLLSDVQFQGRRKAFFKVGGGGVVLNVNL